MAVNFADWSMEDAKVYGTATTGTTESVAVTFGALADGETLTIGSLTFTAADDLTGAEVAAEFAKINAVGVNAEATTKPGSLADLNTAVTAAVGAFTGTLDYSASASGAVVTFTSTTADTDQADLVLGGTSAVAATGVVTQGAASKIDSISIHNASGANAAITTLDTAITGVTAEQAKYGAYLSRLQYASDNIGNVATNLDQSRSRIQDADYAVETTALARTQIIAQASTAMLAQANQVKQTVLALLQ
jgi:flagellin